MKEQQPGISKRIFLKVLGTGAGGLAAAGTGAFAAREAAQRGWDETPILFDPESTHNMLVFTDIHADEIDNPPWQLNSKAEETLREALTILSDYPFDSYANLGDTINGDPKEEGASTRRLRTIYTLLHPFFHAVGNHDSDAMSAEALASIHREFQKPLYGEMDCGDFRSIWFHTDSPTVRGRVSEEVLTWLEETLKPDIPTVIFTHHPPTVQKTIGNFYFASHPENTTFQNSKELWQILTHAPPNAIFCGHMHWKASYVKDGIPVFVLQSFTQNTASAWPHHPSVYTILGFACEARDIVIQTYSRNYCTDHQEYSKLR